MAPLGIGLASPRCHLQPQHLRIPQQSFVNRNNFNRAVDLGEKAIRGGVDFTASLRRRGFAAPQHDSRSAYAAGQPLQRFGGLIMEDDKSFSLAAIELRWRFHGGGGFHVAR